jgi:methionyl aminopeptidase
MTLIKTTREIELLQAGGRIARKAIDEAVSLARAGMTTLELNAVAEQSIAAAGATPSFKGYEGFGFATCINVNAGIVHGIPSNYRLRRGDIVSVDLGVLYQGLHTDVSESFELETHAQEQFLQVGRDALAGAIAQCVLGNKVGDISSAIQATVERAGYSVSRDLAGHGVGRQLHEDPYVECFGRPGKGRQIVEGMTLALEVIYQQGRPELSLAKDGWTLVTKDGSLSGLFEKSVAVTRQGVLVLT